MVLLFRLVLASGAPIAHMFVCCTLHETSPPLRVQVFPTGSFWSLTTLVERNRFSLVRLAIDCKEMSVAEMTLPGAYKRVGEYCRGLG